MSVASQLGTAVGRLRMGRICSSRCVKIVPFTDCSKTWQVSADVGVVALLILLWIDIFICSQVYAQIEVLSKMPRSRRSMSIALEGDGTPFRRNGSRLSSESVSNAPTSTIHSSRPSIDKPRTVKMLYNKVSQDFINGSDPGHRKMDSFASANTKQSLASKGDRSPKSPTFSVWHFSSIPSFFPSNPVPRRIRAH